MFPFLIDKYFSTFGAKIIGQLNQILAPKSKLCTIDKETFYNTRKKNIVQRLEYLVALDRI